MDKIDFVEWLQGELDKQNWKKADLAKASGISSAHITRIMKREQDPGSDACIAIARALKLPPEDVFRFAGILPPKPEEAPGMGELIHLYLEADPEERDRMLDIARALSRRSRKE